jgi:hypothetical protein
MLSLLSTVHRSVKRDDGSADTAIPVVFITWRGTGLKSGPTQMRVN